MSFETLELGPSYNTAFQIRSLDNSEKKNFIYIYVLYIFPTEFYKLGFPVPIMAFIIDKGKNKPNTKFLTGNVTLYF